DDDNISKIKQRKTKKRKDNIKLLKNSDSNKQPRIEEQMPTIILTKRREDSAYVDDVDYEEIHDCSNNKLDKSSKNDFPDADTVDLNKEISYQWDDSGDLEKELFTPLVNECSSLRAKKDFIKVYLKGKNSINQLYEKEGPRKALAVLNIGYMISQLFIFTSTLQNL
ncbi:4784_t:CDS:2, partial [Cetraspora pellucida]